MSKRKKRTPLHPEHPALLAAVEFSQAQFEFWLSTPADAHHNQLHRIATGARLAMFSAADATGESPTRFEKMALTAARSCVDAVEQSN